MKDPIFVPLAAALKERVRLIGDRAFYLEDPVRHLEGLKDVSGRIESLQACLRAPVDVQLKHYLERRSYEKALSLLEEWTAGACDG
ncbi:MAG: hypothetical protein JWQ44_2164 [Chthoniobacter sp.]|nr:hypothetical protein [Chthoniobacter sp.]